MRRLPHQGGPPDDRSHQGGKAVRFAKATQRHAEAVGFRFPEDRKMAITALRAQLEARPRGLHTVVSGALWLALALALALAWLAFPYLMNGRRILGDVGFSVQAERMTRSTATARLLLRAADGPGDADVDALFATAEYLDLMDPQAAARKYEPGKYLVFCVPEPPHVDALPAAPPRATLAVDGQAIGPADVKGPGAVQHHRTSVVRFPLGGPTGQPILTSSSRKLELRLESPWDGGHPSSRTVLWDLPINYPPGTSINGMWSFALVASLSAGLLSAVLTPCLLPIVIVYFAAIAGMGIGSRAESVDRNRLLVFATAFVAAFTTLYTAAGAIIGHLGHQSQMLFAAINRPAAIISGTVIVLLAIWMARSSRVPVVCRLPMPAMVDRMDRGGVLRGALTAAAFS